MIQTRDFKTRNEIVKKEMPRINGNNQFKSSTIVAMDGGYSGVKGVSPNKLFAFPSYAKKAPANFSIVSELKKDDILFKDNKTGEIWLIGRTAEALMNQDDVDSTSDSTLYARYRYNSEIYKVLMTCGVALGLYGLGVGTELYLQTGLPSEYLEKDTPKLKKALVGDYDVALKIGNNDWTNIKFDLDEDHIDVMEQPKGTLNALVYDMGKPTAKGASLLKKNVIIMDVGFGTEDWFAFQSGISVSHETKRDTAMKSVFELVAEKLKKKDIDVKVFEFQKYLEEGVVPYFDEETYDMNYEPFGVSLEQDAEPIFVLSVEQDGVLPDEQRMAYQHMFTDNFEDDMPRIEVYRSLEKEWLIRISQIATSPVCCELVSTSDKIRNALTELGFTIKDTKDGFEWSL
jgi:hypothetical protein